MPVSLEQFAVLTNVGAVALVILIAAAAQRHFRKDIFKPWIWAHFWELISIGAELQAQALGRDPLIASYQVIACLLSLWFLVQTAMAARGRQLSRRTFALAVAPASALLVGALWAGASYVVVAASVVLPISFALIGLGITMYRHSDVDRRFTFTWLTLPLVLRGLFMYAFPFAAAAGVTWVFEALAAVLHAFAGLGMVLYLAKAGQDVVERQNQELRRLDALKNDFLSTVSHELRTPLTCIQSAAGLLVHERLDPDTAKSLAVLVEKNSRRLADMVNDLLDFTRMENGMYRIDRQEDELNATVLAAGEAFAAEAREKQLELRCTVPRDPVVATVDVSRLRQALENLIANALKFTPAGGRVEVWLEQADGTARIGVRDTGVGIPAAHQADIFDRFYQIDGTSTRPVGGAGLGLAIVKHIVEDGHGGRVELESAPDRGSTFTIVLPGVDTSAAIAG